MSRLGPVGRGSEIVPLRPAVEGEDPSRREERAPRVALASTGGRLFAEALGEILKRRPSVSMVAPPVYDARAASSICSAHRPDVLIICTDGSPPPQIADQIRHLKASCEATKVLLLSPSALGASSVLDYIESGVDGFVDERNDIEQFLSALADAAETGTVLDAENVREALRDATWQRDAAGRMLGSLTRREREILPLLIAGLNNEAIGLRLHISMRTVATHVQNLFRKLGVHSRIEAAALVNRTGMLGDSHNASLRSHG